MKREQSQAQTRAKLLEAGRAEVVRKGFEAASVRDIAAAAGFSQGALYSNFESKEQLLLEVLATQKEAELAQIGAALDAIHTAEEARGALDAWIRSMPTQCDLAIFNVEIELHAGRNEDFRELYEPLAKTHIKLVGALIARIFDALKLTPATPADQLAAGFIGLSHALALARPKLSSDVWYTTYKAFVDGVIASAKAAARKR